MIAGRKIGFYATGEFESFPIEKTVDILGKIGYDAIELNISWMDGCKSTKELLRQCAFIKAAGMELSELVVQKDYVTRDPDECKVNIEATKKYISKCAECGIPVVNLFTGPRPWIENPVRIGGEITLSEAWDRVFEAFDQIVPFAEEAKVQIAVENVWAMMCHDFFTMHFLVSRYDSPYLGVNYDPSHDLLAGNTDVEFIIRQWDTCIKHVHLKDAAGTQHLGQVVFPPIGEGLVDWAGFVHGLDAISYKGVLSVEYESWGRLKYSIGGDWIKAAEETYNTLKNIL